MSVKHKFTESERMRGGVATKVRANRLSSNGHEITRRDCEMVDVGWHRFWARRGMSPPNDYALSGEFRNLTALENGLQRVTKPDGDNGRQQKGA